MLHQPASEGIQGNIQDLKDKGPVKCQLGVRDVLSSQMKEEWFTLLPVSAVYSFVDTIHFEHAYAIESCLESLSFCFQTARVQRY